MSIVNRATPTATFLVVLIFVSIPSLAQVSDEVSLQVPDLKKLEWLTHESVNTLRTDKTLSALAWDDVLYRAAKDQADFLIREKKISHTQKTKGKRTPAERVKIHGGTVFKIVGENIVAVSLGAQLSVKGRKLSTVTYHAAAHAMAQLWKSSAGHYKNILSKKYNCTALAITYDSLN